MNNYQLPEGYKQTEVGVIPEEWESIRLGKVMTLQRGFDLPSRLREEGTIPIISSSGITDFHNEAPVNGPGVVTGRYGTIGEVFFVVEDYWPLNTTLFVSDFKGNDPLFVYFFLRTIDYRTYSGKSGVPGVNRNDLHEILVRLPPLTEQKAIATTLSDIDALIAKLDKLIAKKRHLKTATMQQLLTGKKRLPGFGEGKGYQQTEVGVIPEDWDKLPIGEVITLQRGFDLPNRLRKVGKVPIISSSGVIDTHNEAQVRGPGVVTGRYGTIGDVFFVNEDYWPLNTTLFVSDFKDNDPLYVYFFLRTIDYGTYSGKSGVPGVNRNDLHEILVGLPSLPEQRVIATVLSDIDTEIIGLETRRTKTQAIKQGMMQELLTGRTRLV